MWNEVSFSRKKSAIRRRFLFFNLLGITHVCAPYSTYIPIHFDFYLSCELSLSAICLLIISTTPHIVSNQSKCFFFLFFLWSLKYAYSLMCADIQQVVIWGLKYKKMSKGKKREQNTIIHSHLILTMQTWAIIQIRDLCFSHKLYWTI